MKRVLCKESKQEIMSGCELVGDTIQSGRVLMRLHCLLTGNGRMPENQDQDDEEIVTAIVSILMLAADDQTRDMDAFIRRLLSTYEQMDRDFTEYLEDPTIGI